MDFNNFGKVNNLMQIQKESIENLLKGDEANQSQFKVLVQDKFSQDIISTMFKKGNLFDLNVTLFKLIGDRREQLPGVNVIYMILPTQENINLVIKDFRDNLYDKVFIHFTSNISNESLMQFGNQIQAQNGLGKIQLVYENYLNFVCLHDNLFISNIPNVYRDFKIAKSKQNVKISGLYQQIAESLQAVIKQFKAKPQVYYQGNHSENIFNYLKNIFDNEQVQEDNNSISSDDEQNQVSLIILERDIDLNPCLVHPFGYSTVIHDIYDIKLNKIVMEDSKSKKPVAYDLDIIKDEFLRQNFLLDIPDVMQNIKKDVEEYEKEYNKLTNINSETDDLSQALESVSQSTIKKKFLELHTNIIDNFINTGIQDRKLNQFYEIEEDMIYTKKLSNEHQKLYLDILKQETFKDETLEYFRQQDRLRILIIQMLNQVNMELFDQAVQNSNITIKEFNNILEYFKELTQQKSKSQTQLQSEANNQYNIQQSLLTNFAMITNKMKTVGKGVYHKLSGQDIKDMSVKIVDNIINKGLSQNLKNNGFQFENLNKQTNVKKNPQTIVVYFPEGLTYSEFIGFQDLAQKTKKQIICGGSIMLSAHEALRQIQQTL